VVLVVVYMRDPIVPGPLRHIDFAAQDGLDAMFFRDFEELDGTVKHAVIRHGTRAHPEFLRPRHKVGQLAGAIEQRVLGVQVQVGELTHATLPFHPGINLITLYQFWTVRQVPVAGESWESSLSGL